MLRYRRELSISTSFAMRHKYMTHGIVLSRLRSRSECARDLLTPDLGSSVLARKGCASRG